MRIALAGLSFMLLIGCGDGLPGFSNDDGDGSGLIQTADGSPENCVSAEKDAKGADHHQLHGKGKSDKTGKHGRSGGSRPGKGDEEPTESPEKTPCKSEPDDDGVEIPPPTGVSVSYARDVVPIMNTSCVTCHRAGNASGGVALDTYEVVKNGSDVAIDSITSGRMPIGNFPPVSDEQVKILKKWASEGFPY